MVSILARLVNRWQVVIHMAFVLSAVAIAFIDRLMSAPKQSLAGAQPS